MNAFVAEGADDGVGTSDSMPALLEIHDALSRLYAELAIHPTRGPEAAVLLSEVSSEYDRLLRQVGREALARALDTRTSRDSAHEPAPATMPPAAATAPAIDSSPPVSEDAVREWAARYRERTTAQPPVSVALVLHSLLDRVGPPPEDLGPEGREHEIDRLEQATSEDTFRELRLLPNEVQRSYLRLLTARLNAVRTMIGGDVFARERVGRSLGVIRDYTREHRPGAVYGLSRDHEPKGGTWGADAQHLWHRLARDDDELPPSTNGSVIRSVRRHVEPEPDEVDDREGPGPDASWPFWQFVRERNVLMIGGAPRESARVRIERAFAMRELVWSADDPRKAQSAEARVLAGGYDMVIVLLRFMSHATNEKLVHACASRGVPYVPVEHGYGVASIRRCVERFLAPRAEQSVSK